MDRLVGYFLQPFRWAWESVRGLLPGAGSPARNGAASDAKLLDLERAWAAGLAELAAAGIALHETPLYLVFGTRGPQAADALMRAAGLDSQLPPNRDRHAPLSWYATPEAIFIVVSAVGGTNQVVHTAATSPTTAQAGAQSTPLQAPTPFTSPSAGGGYATLQIDNPSAFSDPARWSGVSAARPAAPADLDLEPEQARLRYLCELLVDARTPVCPLNGMLVLLPFDAVQHQSQQLHDTLRTDLEIIQQTTMLRFPVMALVSEMHTEAGFAELVRRVGPELAREQRFGKGSDHRTPPTSEHVLAVTRHACGAFEDWTYMLFQQDGGLQQPGNTALLGLLCKIRGEFTNALVAVLTSGFGSDAEEFEDESEQLLFTGCYFAATGTTPEGQAFVRGVFGKLCALQGEIAWTAAAYQRDRRYQRRANLAVAAGLVGLGLLGLLWWQG